MPKEQKFFQLENIKNEVQKLLKSHDKEVNLLAGTRRYFKLSAEQKIKKEVLRKLTIIGCNNYQDLESILQNPYNAKGAINLITLQPFLISAPFSQIKELIEAKNNYLAAYTALISNANLVSSLLKKDISLQEILHAYIKLLPEHTIAANDVSMVCAKILSENSPKILQLIDQEFLLCEIFIAATHPETLSILKNIPDTLSVTSSVNLALQDLLDGKSKVLTQIKNERIAYGKGAASETFKHRREVPEDVAYLIADLAGSKASLKLAGVNKPIATHAQNKRQAYKANTPQEEVEEAIVSMRLRDSAISLEVIADSLNNSVER